MYFVTYHISFHCNIPACNPVSSGIPHSLWCCVIDIPWPFFLVSRGKMTVDQCCTVNLFLLLTSLPPSLHFLLPISLSLSISPPPSLPQTMFWMTLWHITSWMPSIERRLEWPSSRDTNTRTLRTMTTSSSSTSSE